MEGQWMDGSHGRMTMHNDADHAMPMGAMMTGMGMTGPNGTMPMLWSPQGTPACEMDNGTATGWRACTEADFAGMSMPAGGDVMLGMHAVRFANGTEAMMVMPMDGMQGMMHGMGEHMPMAGDHSVHMGGRTMAMQR